MSESIIEQLDAAIQDASEFQGFMISSIDVRPTTHISLLKHLGLIGVTRWVERYKGFNVNITHSLSQPFRVNTDPQPNFQITSFKFKEIGANKWQHIDYDFSSGVSEHTKAAVSAIMHPNQ